jgi:putative transferase (TIGR04331 family)
MERRYLALTSERVFWRTDGEVVFLGEWCLDGERPDFPHVVLESPWNRVRDIDRVASYLEEFIDSLMRHLAEALNAYHGIRYSARQWQILLGNWALHVVHVLYDRFLLFEQAAGTSLPLWTCVPPLSEAVIPRTTERFKYAQLYPDTALLLLGRFAKSAGIQCEYTATPQVRADRSRYERGSWSSLVRDVAGRLRNRMQNQRCRGKQVVFLASGVHPPTLAKIGGDIGHVANLTKWSPLRWRPIDQPGRERVFAGLAAPDDFRRRAAEMLPHLLPTSFLEDFEQWQSRAGSRPWGGSAKACITAYGFSGDDLFSYQAARFEQGGGRLVGVQHGGGYGSFRYCPEEAHETRCADAYATWGWAAEQGCHHALPSLYLTELVENLKQRGHDADGGDLLLVTTDRPQFTHRIQSHPLTGQMSRYYSWQERFYEALSEGARQGFQLKPYPADYAVGRSTWWGKRSIKTAGGGAVDMLSRFRILVFDHNATGFLEALSANVPTIVFWDSELWEIRDAALASFSTLERVGVFYRSPESAAGHVNAVWADVSPWWKSDDVQQARGEFCDRFARTSKDWAEDWREFLCKEVQRSGPRATTD